MRTIREIEEDCCWKCFWYLPKSYGCGFGGKMTRVEPTNMCEKFSTDGANEESEGVDE